MRVELHTLLSAIYTAEKQPTDALKQIQQALQYHAAYSNNLQECEILTLLEQAEQNNPDLYQKHAQTIATVLHLMYNHAKQNDNAAQKNYDSLIGFASYDLCQKLLPYLECAYTTNKQNKDYIAYLLALLYQQNNNYLKAYNYQQILPQGSPYLAQLSTGMFALDHKKDAQIIIYALNMLDEGKIHADNPIIKPMCQFVLNELPTESFIKTITY